jgi:hypothetical protein
MKTHKIVFAGGVVTPVEAPQGRAQLVFHFDSANAATTQFEIWGTAGSDVTGCLPDTNWVKRKADECYCPGTLPANVDFLATFTANGAVATATQIGVKAGSQVIYELRNKVNTKWIKVEPIGAAAGVSVTLEYI